MNRDNEQIKKKNRTQDSNLKFVIYTCESTHIIYQCDNYRISYSFVK